MDRLFILRNHMNGSASVKEYAPHQSLGTIVLLQPRRIGSEHRSPSKRERTIQHSGHSSSGFGKHKEQLQRNSVHSRRCVAISARRQARAQR